MSNLAAGDMAVVVRGVYWQSAIFDADFAKYAGKTVAISGPVKIEFGIRYYQIIGLPVKHAAEDCLRKIPPAPMLEEETDECEVTS